MHRAELRTQRRSHLRTAFIPCTFFLSLMEHLTAISGTWRQPHHHIPPNASYLWVPITGTSPLPRKPEVLLVPQSWPHRDTNQYLGLQGQSRRRREPPAEKRLTAGEKAAGSRALARGGAGCSPSYKRQSQQPGPQEAKDGPVLCGRKNTLI